RRRPVMDPAGFERTFGGLIRARLDWSRLRALAASGRVKVADEVVLDRHRLAALDTVWYVDGSGAPTDHHRPGAVNLRVGQAAELASGEPLIAGWEARGKRLVELQTSLRASGGPVVLALPAYRIGGGRALLLDGTHRVVAAVGAR